MTTSCMWKNKVTTIVICGKLLIVLMIGFVYDIETSMTNVQIIPIESFTEALNAG